MASLFSSKIMLLSDLQVFHLATEKVTWQRTQALWQSFASSVSSLSSYWWLHLSNALNHLEPCLRGLKMCLWYENLCHLADVISSMNIIDNYKLICHFQLIWQEFSLFILRHLISWKHGSYCYKVHVMLQKYNYECSYVCLHALNDYINVQKTKIICKLL